MSQEDIYNLGRDNVLIHNWLKLYQYNRGVTYTEALEGMVISLAEENSHLKNELLKLYSGSVDNLHKEMLLG